MHHDLWDMDLPSQPTLVDLPTADGVVAAVIQPAKTGNLFVLNRRTGQLIVPAPERPVPQGPAPGDRVAPTQPFSELTFRPEAKLTGADMWGATIFDQLACRIMFHRMRYEGTFTPPSLQGTLVFPGNLGMFEWGGIAVDPVRQIAIANPIAIPFVSRRCCEARQSPAPTAEHRRQRNRRAADVRRLRGPACVSLAGGCHAARPGAHGGYRPEDDEDRMAASQWHHSRQRPVPIRSNGCGPRRPDDDGWGRRLPDLRRTITSAPMIDRRQAVVARRLPAGGQSTPMSYAIDGKQYWSRRGRSRLIRSSPVTMSWPVLPD